MVKKAPAKKKVSSVNKANKVSSQSNLFKNKWVVLAILVVVAGVGTYLIRQSFAYSSVGNCTTTNFRRVHPTQGSNSDCTKLLQGQLVRLKFLDKGKNGGQIDGVYGPNTAAAIRVAETFYKFRYPDDSAEFCTANILDYAEQVGRDNVNAVISYGQRYFKSCY